MAEKKPWEPAATVGAMGLLAVIGMGAMMTGVFVIPGAALLAYAMIFPVVEGIEHGWNGLERLADWWSEGRR
jgi:hypothetical protein